MSFSPSSREAHDNDGEGPDGWAQDDVEFDIFDFDIARTEGELPEPRDLPAAPSLSEILDEQRRDSFCQQVLASQSHKQRAFFEGTDGLLLRRHPIHDELVQIVLPETLRPRVLQLCHYTIVAGYPGLNRMYYHIRKVHYWPHLVADVEATVRNCPSCARNRVKLRRDTNYLKLFTATKPFESVSIEILGRLPKSRRDKRFLLVITDRFSNLTAVVPLRNVNACSTAVAFCEAWVFKYGPPKTLLSDNGKQFASRFFLSVCQLLGVTNAFTSAYHPQVNGQVERYNRTILSMLRCYAEVHKNDWDRYESALTYAYNNHVHRITGTTPFELTLSRPPPPFSLHKAIRQRPAMDRRDRHELLKQLDEAIQKAFGRLKKSEKRYKLDFDTRARRANLDLEGGDCIFLDPTLQEKKLGKLTSPAVGPYRVIAREQRTFTMDRAGITERVNRDRVTRAPRPASAVSHPVAPGGTENVTEGPDDTVERILNHHVGHEQEELEFLIKWADYEEPTWTGRSHVPEELVSRYFRKRNRRANRATPA